MEDFVVFAALGVVAEATLAAFDLAAVVLGAAPTLLPVVLPLVDSEKLAVVAWLKAPGVGVVVQPHTPFTISQLLPAGAFT